MANLCIKTPSSAIIVLIFQLLVLRPRPTAWEASLYLCLYLFSHFGSCVDIVDSPDVTLACTDDNYDVRDNLCLCFIWLQMLNRAGP